MRAPYSLDYVHIDLLRLRGIIHTEKAPSCCEPGAYERGCIPCWTRVTALSVKMALNVSAQRKSGRPKPKMKAKA